MPAEHLLGRLDAALDLSWPRSEPAPFRSLTGRPPIDPEPMIRMLLVGCCHGVRSERRLCDEVHLSLGCRWFRRLGLDGAVPDRSTFSKARHGRFRDAEAFRRVFEAVVGPCMSAGLMGGKDFAVDASVIEADANHGPRVDGSALPSERADPATATRPVRESLTALDAAADRMAGEADGDGPPERLAGEPAPARSLSLTDPAAAWTSKGSRRACLAHGTNDLVDLERAIVVDVAATPARRSEEVASTSVMIERTRQRFGLTPSRPAGDAACGTGLLVGWPRRQGIEPHVPGGIEPHVPVPDGEGQKAKGPFGRTDLAFDRERDVYVCP